MSDDDPLDKMERLAKRLAEVTEPLGLDLQHFSPIIDVKGVGQKPILQAMFFIDPAAFETVKELDEVDDLLQGILAATIVEEREAQRQAISDEEAAKMAEVRARLIQTQERLERGGDIL